MSFRYIKHYNSDARVGSYRLTCDRFSQIIAGWANRPGGAQGFEASPAPCSGPSSPTREHKKTCRANGDPSDLVRTELWAAALRIQWALKCDRLLTVQAVLDVIAALQADGVLEGTRQAYRRLAAALPAAYPGLLKAGADREICAQLIALGRDMASAVGQDPELFAYVKNELQPVSLATLLRL